jgi:5-(carboxyamino)imidazole ribonucleotide mutase
MLAAVTTLPVIGVPVALARLDGMDSLLSIVQMPRGVPVATVAINGATNAGLLAARILAVHDERIAQMLETYRLELADQAKTQDQNLPRP